MNTRKLELRNMFDSSCKGFESIPTNKLLKMSLTPCIYILYENTEIVYIGETTNLLQRISQHTASDKVFDNVNFFIYIGCNQKRKEKEKELINFYQPKYNIIHNNNADPFYLHSFYKTDILYRYKNECKHMQFKATASEIKKEVVACLEVLRNYRNLNNLIIYSNNIDFIRALYKTQKLDPKQNFFMCRQLREIINLQKKTNAYINFKKC